MDVYREQAKERMLIGKQPNPTQLIAEGHKGEAAEQIAKATGTNRQYIKDAVKLKKDEPGKFKEIKANTKRNEPRW